MKMGQSVSKRRRIKFRRRVITQKKAYNIQNTSKVRNQEIYTWKYMASKQDGKFKINPYPANVESMVSS